MRLVCALSGWSKNCPGFAPVRHQQPSTALGRPSGSRWPQSLEYKRLGAIVHGDAVKRELAQTNPPLSASSSPCECKGCFHSDYRDHSRPRMGNALGKCIVTQDRRGTFDLSPQSDAVFPPAESMDRFIAGWRRPAASECTRQLVMPVTRGTRTGETVPISARFPHPAACSIPERARILGSAAPSGFSSGQSEYEQEPCSSL